MESIFVIVLFVLVTLTTISTTHYRNPFEAVQGCLQHDNVPSYNETLEYFATDNFRYVGRTNTSKFIRVGMVGLTDGILRYSNVPYPYEESVVQIYIAGLSGQHSVINRHTRTSNTKYNTTILKSMLTPNVMSPTRPLMFRLEVFDNGNVLLTKDGQQKAFLEFSDNYKLQLDYIAFSKWDHDVFYYYDCPLNADSNSIDDTVLLKCKLA